MLDGACKVGPLLARAAELEMPALAMTDHGVMHGTIEFYNAANKAGVKPIIGCELYVAPGDRRLREGGERASNNHLVALAKDIEGYHNLLQLTSHAYTSGFYYKPRVDMELLEQYSKGIVFLSACLKGKVAQAIVQEQEAEAEAFAGSMIDLVGRENFFLEIMDHGIEEQHKANAGIMPLAKKLDLRVVATNDTHYLNNGDHDAHDILLCVGTGKKRSDVKRMRYTSHEFYLKSAEEMLARFGHLPDALSNTLLVAEMCNVEVPLAEDENDNSKYPKYDVPDGKTPESYLRELTEKGMEWRYGDRSTDRHREQMRYELGVIHNSGFDAYFLIVWDFINFARERKIPVGPGRGSGAGCIVAYALGITDLDPLEHNLVFERFLNSERLEPPDFDIDFCTDRRHIVVNYVREKYGAENVCNIVTFGKLKAKNAIRDVGRVLDVPLDRVNMICNLVPADLKATVGSSIKGVATLRGLYESEPDVKELLNYARQVEGLSRNTSVHACGVVITDRPVREFVPVFAPGGDKEELVSQFAMPEVTASGLLKMDFLGLKNLTVIDNASRMIREDHGVEIDWAEIPRSDEKTYEFLRTGETTGVFQLESSGMRELVINLGPTCFADVAAIIALYRPGPMENIPLYTKAKKNPEEAEYPHPMLRDVLGETYGVIVYQEQVMQIAQKMGNFTLGRADILRKAMGKKKEDLMAQMRVEFVDGARENDIDERTADKVWRLMAKFAEYGFNKAHTVAYAEVAFRTAYLKAHYPVEFMAALMTNDMDNTDKMAKLFAEARDMGVKVLPPDVNESAENFTVVAGNIRFGMAAIKNVGHAAVKEVIMERGDNGPFTSFQSMCERTLGKGVNSRMVESLIKVGAFDSLSPGRARLMAGLDSVIEAALIAVKNEKEGQPTFFDDLDDGMAKVALPRVTEWSDAEKLKWEKDLTGFFITGHPLDALAVDMRSFSTTNTEEFPKEDDKTPVRLIGQISDVRRITTKKGDPMAFIQIADFHGAIEAVVFPSVFEAAEPWLISGAMVCASGKVNERNGVKSLAVDSLTDAETARIRLAKYLDVTLPVSSISPDSLGRLKQAFGRHTGRCRVRISVDASEGPVTIQTEGRFSVDPCDELLQDVERLDFSKSLTFAEV